MYIQTGMTTNTIPILPYRGIFAERVTIPMAIQILRDANIFALVRMTFWDRQSRSGGPKVGWFKSHELNLSEPRE